METPDYKDYVQCTSRDLICDPLFQQWVIAPTAEADAFWGELVRRYPATQQPMEEAQQLLTSLSFRIDEPGDEIANSSFNQVAAQLGWLAGDREPVAAPVRSIRRRMWWSAVAAAAVVAIMLLLVNRQSDADREKVAHQTSYGSKKQVTLPDGSVVVLNAHSTIEYPENWEGQPVREVRLTGEGYFQVTRQFVAGTKTPQAFKVQTDNLVVEVLGTSFDIRERRGITEVVLETGKIALHFNNPSHQAITMKPGDRVVYDPARQQPARDTANAKDFSAWKHNKLILKDPNVGEIIRYLEDNYGKKIILEDPRMAERAITGPIYYDNLNDALFILSTVLNTQVIKQDSIIVLRPRN
ncbi:FecR family protein [Paraflavitalea pollutisoli]|uniref:FecR family protein n=1 Tax=Paraflavitalea pollutisoli TaxID=3034143 RepID=UPI0023EAA96B|nr:FecR domain-containing protein [Paraflavitalea sp. H1-2-19X]